MRVPPHTNLFTQVDRTNDPDFFVRFMDEAQKPAGIQASKRLMRDRLALAPGAALLDAISRTMNQRFGQRCSIHGVKAKSKVRCIALNS